MKSTQYDKRNVSMVMDLYELTMANGYFQKGDPHRKVAFDVFYRKNPEGGGFSIFAGLEQIVEYLQGMHFTGEDIDYLKSLNLFCPEFLEYLRTYRFSGDLYSFPEGTVMYPGEPVVTVIAPLIEAQLIETALLLEFNHQSLIATKTQRIVRAASGKAVSDFGARRAHNVDAAVYGARAAYIGGAVGTATVLAGQMFGIPVSGTMAHSWVMYFDNEYEAFKNYALSYPDSTVLLVDTYNVLKSGVPNAICTSREILEPMGKTLKGIRLDSGDLAYLSKEARRMLDEAGLEDCKIIASNSLDEYTISSLISQKAQIDSFGVGERLITSRSNPVFGGVYKLCAVENEEGIFEPKIKISENTEKITNPGLKCVYRVYNQKGVAVADLLTMAEEVVNFDEPYRFVDPNRPWKQHHFEGCRAKKLQEQYIRGGELVHSMPETRDIAAYVKKQLDQEIWVEELRFENPHVHFVDMSPSLYECKMDLLEEES